MSLCEFYHGKRWRQELGAPGMAGALLLARGLFDLHDWVDAHRKQ